MNSKALFATRAVAGVLLASACGLLMAAPGEDPVQLQAKVSYLQLPTPGRVGSSDIQHRTGMPDEARAKMARYTAKAYSADTGSIQTEKDVVSAVRTNSLGTTTCVQSLSPAHPTGHTMGEDQVVVIRGDLVNICR